MDQAAKSPFVWIDDESTDIDRTWVAAHHPGAALLHAVPPSVGLTTDDVHEIATWLEGLKGR